MKKVTDFAAPTINTDIDFWPSMIDMLTSILMVFLLIYFVQYYFNSGNLESAIAENRRDIFKRTLEREFSGEKEVLLTAELNSLRITFGEGVLFKPTDYQLQPKGEVVLTKLAEVFNTTRSTLSGQQPYKEIQIEGHTDPDTQKGKVYPHDNWELSTARALEVLKFLARKATPPLDEKAMSANGFASNRPAPGDKAKSRRIEILIKFSGEESSKTSTGK